MPLRETLSQITSSLLPGVRLVAVSKNQPAGTVLEAYRCGQRIFGENRAQELVQKAPLLPPDIEWHFIGHLQRNKVRQVLPFVGLIHSVDSLQLLKEIEKESLRIGKLTDCLLQFHIASEETKFGLSPDEARALLNSALAGKMDHVRFRGVMGMASLTGDTALVRKEFAALTSIFTQIKQEYFIDNHYFNELSMGMSSDYRIAMEEGSTLVRIGTALFGERN